MIRKLALLCLLLTGATPFAAADNASPVGLWRTIDDVSGKEKSLVRIVDVHGEYRGTIEKLFREPNEDPNPLCDKCSGDKKDKPVIGMMIITGMRADGEVFAGGSILDPKNGKVYKSKMWLEEQGKKLHVRGFIGMSLLGRTQVWLREQ